MTLYSHLSVQVFNDKLSVEILSDVNSLLQNKKEIISINNLIQHTPRDFVKLIPLILVYSILKPLGLFEHFCEIAEKKLTTNQYYMIAKLIEIEYKIISPNIMLPLSVCEASKIYDETRSKSVGNLVGSSTPSGKFQTVRNRLHDQASEPMKVPTGLVLYQHDNNQVIGKTHEMKTYNKQNTTIINAGAHLVCDPDNSYQYTESSYPGRNVYRDLTESEIKTSVPQALMQFKSHFRAERKGGLDRTIEHLKSEFTHEPLVEKLKKVKSDFEGVRFCNNCGVVTKRTDIRCCVDCDSKSFLIKVKD